MFLVVGALGQLGTEIHNILQDKATYVDINELDITNEEAVKKYLTDNDFEVVINCSAYTAVDKAEDEPEKCELVNYQGVANLAKYAKSLIHVSTDYVFDGSQNVPYIEADTVNPISVYGKTKLKGELAIKEYAKKSIIIRTAWLYSPYGNNFVKTMIKLGKTRDELKVIFDQSGTPTYAKDLAKAIVSILESDKFKTTAEMNEIYHFSNEGVCSWYDFAVSIMEYSNLSCKVIPIETFEYPTKAVRPQYSVLNKKKIKQDFGITIPHWQTSLKECITRLSEETLAK